MKLSLNPRLNNKALSSMPVSFKKSLLKISCFTSIFKNIILHKKAQKNMSEDLVKHRPPLRIN